MKNVVIETTVGRSPGPVSRGSAIAAEDGTERNATNTASPTTTNAKRIRATATKPHESKAFEAHFVDARPSVASNKDSLAYRVSVLNRPGMLSTDEAGALVGVSRVAVNKWIRSGRAIGLTRTKHGYAVPNWQFEPSVWAVLEHLSRALDTVDGWTLLWFLDSPHPALSGRTPRQALEHGVEATRILELAEA